LERARDDGADQRAVFGVNVFDVATAG